MGSVIDESMVEVVSDCLRL